MLQLSKVIKMKNWERQHAIYVPSDHQSFL